MKTKVLRNGTLKKKQLETLAAALKKYDPATLKKSGKPSVNPRVLTIKYGKHSAEIILKAGAELPKPDTTTNRGRAAGIVAAVHKAIPPKK